MYANIKGNRTTKKNKTPTLQAISETIEIEETCEGKSSTMEKEL